MSNGGDYMSKVKLPVSSTCFIDANIIYYIEKLKTRDGFRDIIEQVYESVYIHEEVYKELSNSSQKFVDEKCDLGKWYLLKPLQEFQLSMDEYRTVQTSVQKKLFEIDERRGKSGSAGTGEIASLAAAYLLNAEIICSNDYSIEEVIREVPLHIFIDGDDSKDQVLITHHRLLDFCKLVVDGDLLARKEVKKFYQVAYIELKESNRKLYEERIAEFDQAIPSGVKQ